MLRCPSLLNLAELAGCIALDGACCLMQHQAEEQFNVLRRLSWGMRMAEGISQDAQTQEWQRGGGDDHHAGYH